MSLVVYLSFLFSVDFEKEKERWAKDLDDMKATLRASENNAASVRALADSRCADADHRLALAKELRRDADRDVFQALDSVRNLQGQLEAANAKFEALWNSMKYILGFISEDGDETMNLGEYIPLIPARFYGFLKDSYHNVVSRVLSHFRVLSPDTNLDVIAADDLTEDYLAWISAAEVEVYDLAGRVVSQIDLGDAPSSAGP